MNSTTSLSIFQNYCITQYQWFEAESGTVANNYHDEWHYNTSTTTCVDPLQSFSIFYLLLGLLFIIGYGTYKLLK